MHFHLSLCSLPWSWLHSQSPCFSKISLAKSHIFLPSKPNKKQYVSLSWSFRGKKKKSQCIFLSLIGHMPIPQPITMGGGGSSPFWLAHPMSCVSSQEPGDRWALAEVWSGGCPKASSGYHFDKKKKDVLCRKQHKSLLYYPNETIYTKSKLISLLPVLLLNKNSGICPRSQTRYFINYPEEVCYF